MPEKTAYSRKELAYTLDKAVEHNSVVKTPWGEDYGKLAVRRVAKVYYMRKVDWTDGVL